MSKAYQKNAKVKWAWGQGEGTGFIHEVYQERVTKTLKGSEVTRNASSDNPAYLIEQEDGSKILKSHSELSTCN
ncbi:HVA1 family protein [Alteromonas pelagimontana]|uniref:HVA1 family protein n=1 Tax=Alteromonas pelagimontana TaxID=1858656 RepID=A0A6M4MCA4_9ALTE|nr:DUF2945 domain-containing protein [Alteromonas pelagimontana]QJR80280.1 HVA1 family protein [Alteromonas pelagimontana]